MRLTLDELYSRLTASKLFSAEEVSAILASLPADKRPTDGESFAAQLVSTRTLTHYQAARLCGGTDEKLVLGNYVILDRLGQGGMGAVYKAEHRPMKRLVALKVINPELMDSPVNLKRFQREVETVARLNHPNIVLAHDAGEAEGTRFLVMQLVEGRDLASLVSQEGPMSVARAVDCILQAARGLAYAHRQAIVHRDVKPSNILLEKSGMLKILDLGLASLIQGDGDGPRDETLTASKMIIGSPEYMAPEQAQNPRSRDPRSDIYSLGLTLWFLLTGRVTYEGQGMIGKLLAHRERPIPSLCGVRADVPNALDAIFHRMAAKKTCDRYQTMEEVVTALEDFQACAADAPVSEPTALATAAREPVHDHARLRRYRWLALPSAALLVGGLAFTVMASRATPTARQNEGVCPAIDPLHNEQVKIRSPRTAVGSMADGVEAIHGNRGALGEGLPEDQQ